MKESLIVLGSPWSGKNTLTNKLQAHDSYAVIDSGALIREACKVNPQLNEIVSSGQQIPPEQSFMYVNMALSDRQDAAKVCVNGFPRQKINAERLDDVLGDTLISTISLTVPEEVIYERQQAVSGREGRNDDNVETLRTRLAAYFTKDTYDVLNHYAKTGKLFLLEATVDPESIYLKLVDFLNMLRSENPSTNSD